MFIGYKVVFVTFQKCPHTSKKLCDITMLLIIYFKMLNLYQINVLDVYEK